MRARPSVTARLAGTHRAEQARSQVFTRAAAVVQGLLGSPHREPEPGHSDSSGPDSARPGRPRRDPPARPRAVRPGGRSVRAPGRNRRSDSSDSPNMSGAVSKSPDTRHCGFKAGPGRMPLVARRPGPRRGSPLGEGGPGYEGAALRWYGESPSLFAHAYGARRLMAVNPGPESFLVRCARVTSRHAAPYTAASATAPGTATITNSPRTPSHVPVPGARLPGACVSRVPSETSGNPVCGAFGMNSSWVGRAVNQPELTTLTVCTDRMHNSSARAFARK